ELEAQNTQVSPKSQVSTLVELQCSTKRTANLPQLSTPTPNRSKHQGKLSYQHRSLEADISEKKRFTPYAWVTTIANLMAEEKPCYYAAWLRSQYQIPSKPSDYDTTDHDEMVIQRAVELQNQGYQITVETANNIKVFGQQYEICIAGRPDIVAIKDNWILIEDCKSGKKR
ncbi:MAG: hypothetical protein ACKO5Q_08265, partial [Microcystaceae cyanobacterium]